MVKPEELLSAGACLPPKEKLKNEALADSISARLYRHPALGDRPVVRLTADNLSAGEDLTMEFLGFGKPDVTGPVAKRLRQALGFPGWAIVNDPQHARYALELVKEFKHAVRRSKAKPGFGYDEFTEISKRLGKSVAHFLPSFWEQAGREFIALDNCTYGSRCFGKAREAEKVHALKVDETLRQDAFLEFALAGAVSIKAISEYGKELLAAHDPKAAWKFFRELCVRRTLGGMPPWTSMIKDLQPFIKAAKLDQDDEIQSILVEIIDSPAISRASMTFWDGASKAVAQLVKRNQHVAGVLLNMIPQTSSWRENDTWPWLNHLDAWGILSNAWQDKVSEEAGPTGGPAAWLSRLIRSIDQPKQKLYDILEAMAPRLRADKSPVDIYLRHRWTQHVSADVDLLDMALELQVPFMEVPSSISFDFKKWGETNDKPEELRNRPRDPVHLVADPRFTRAINDALQQAAGEGAFEKAAAGKAALREARRAWLSNLVAGLTNAGLPRAEEALKSLENKTRLAIFQEFPDVLKQLQQSDVRPAVLRTLQGGLLDEYGWPALEQVFDKFLADNQKAPQVYGHFPYAILTDRLKAVVVRGDTVVHEAELKIPKGHELKCLRYLDGDLLVWSGSNYQFSCFWNSDPQPGSPEYVYFGPEFAGVTVDVPGGGTFMAERIVHRGDKGLANLQANEAVVSDGTHWWLRSAEYDQVNHVSEFVLHEVDPKTGKRGRRSLPSFFEDFLKDDAKLQLLACSLLPIGDGFAKSPLGVKDGLTGSRLRRNADGTQRLECIDGRACESSQSELFGFLLDQPASSAKLPVEVVNEYRRAIGFKIWDPTASFSVAEIGGGGDAYSRGQAIAVSPIFLHAFQVRDAQSSEKLRGITAENVRALTDAEQQDFDNFNQVVSAAQADSTPARPKSTIRDEAADSPLLDAAIRQLLGDKVHPRLLTGMRGVIIKAGSKIRQLAKLIESRSAEPTAKVVVDVAAADVDAIPYLETIRSGYRGGFRSFPHMSFMERTAAAAKFFRGEAPLVRFPSDWLLQLRKLSEGLAEQLWLAYCTDPKDQKWVAFANLWMQHPYFNLPGSFRIFLIENREQTLFTEARDAVKAEALEAGEGQAHLEWAIPYIGKSSRYLISKDYRGYEILEYSPSGQFESIPGAIEDRKTETCIPPARWNAERVGSFIELAQSKPLNCPPVDLLKSLGEDVGASPAEIALVWFGLPGVDVYQSNFMPTHLREGCKLKTKECSVAKDTLKELNPNFLRSLVRSVVDGEPSELWEKPPTKVADRIRTAWQAAKVDRLQLSSDWMERLNDVYPHQFNTRQFFQALNSPLSHPLFSPEGLWSFKREKNYVELIPQQDPRGFDTSILTAAIDTFCMLAAGLPVDDPARGKLVDLYQATAKALSNPGLLLWGGTRYTYNDSGKLAGLIETVVGKLTTQDGLEIADDGLLSLARDEHRLMIAYRPSRIDKTAQLVRTANQIQSLISPDGEAMYAQPSTSIQYLSIFLSPEFQAIVDRLKQTDVPAGQYETNPLHSASDIVKQVAKKHKLKDELAAYYLQLLTLADPTDKNITVWNGWKSAEIKKLGSELVEKKLVLEATRARAGRKFFLPGAWEDLKAPHLPIEAWKIPLYQLKRDGNQRPTPPLARIVPLEPVHRLFAKAWKRILDGDVPQYEEVT